MLVQKKGVRNRRKEDRMKSKEWKVEETRRERNGKNWETKRGKTRRYVGWE